MHIFDPHLKWLRSTRQTVLNFSGDRRAENSGHSPVDWWGCHKHLILSRKNFILISGLCQRWLTPLSSLPSATVMCWQRYKVQLYTILKKASVNPSPALYLRPLDWLRVSFVRGVLSTSDGHWLEPETEGRRPTPLSVLQFLSSEN